MTQEISCDVCKDLIPLVKDEVASPDSVALVKNHAAHCPACRAELDEAAPAPIPSDKPIIQKIRRTISLRVLACVALGVALGLSLRLNEMFVYNLFIMPVVGALLYLFSGKKWYYGPGIIAALGSVCRFVTLLLTGQESFDLMVIGISIMAGLTYGLLALLGGGIAALFQYAFAKGE